MPLNKNDDEIEIDLVDVGNFFKSNAIFLTKFIVISIVLFALSSVYYFNTESTVNASFILTVNKIEKKTSPGISELVLGNSEDSRLRQALEILMTKDFEPTNSAKFNNPINPVFGATQIDAITLQSLQDYLPGYISRIMKNNSPENLTGEPDVNSNRAKGDSASFKKENYAQLSALTNPQWITRNIVGLNGMRVENKGKYGGVTGNAAEVFGKDYIYKPYNAIKVTATGKDEKEARALLLNAQTALGRLLQYKSITKWFAEEQQTLKTELPSLNYQISEIDANVADLQNMLMAYNKLFSKALEDSKALGYSPAQLKDLFAGVPDIAVPFDLAFRGRSRASSYETSINEIETSIISSQVASKALKESVKEAKNIDIMFTKYNNLLNDGKDLLLLEPPNLGKLTSLIENELQNKDNEINQNLGTVATYKLHLLMLQTLSLIPQVFNESSVIIYDKQIVNKGKLGIIGGLFGLIFALITGSLFLLIARKSK